MSQVQDDELDFFELFQILWDGKRLISAFVLLAALIGFIYSQSIQPKYKALAPYQINIYSVRAQQICRKDIRCLAGDAEKRMLFFLEGNWFKVKKESILSHTTTMPLDISEHEAIIERANVALSNNFYEEATAELALIQTEPAGSLLSTETIASSWLNAKRLIQFIDSGQSVITINSVSVVKSSGKPSLIVALSAVLGGITGTLVILVRNGIMRRKKELAEA